MSSLAAFQVIGEKEKETTMAIPSRMCYTRYLSEMSFLHQYQFLKFLLMSWKKPEESASVIHFLNVCTQMITRIRDKDSSGENKM